MNNNFKKIIAGTAAVMMLSAGAVFAQENEDAANPAVVTGETAPTETVGQAPIENFTASIETINGVKMLPLRSVSEHFGYEVEWHDESRSVSMTKGAVYITFSIDSDAYALSRMAPQPLGAAPVLFNDETTYVPVSFFTELLGLNCHEAEDCTAVIAVPRIVELSEVKEDGSLSIMDEFYGEVILHIGEDTELVANGEKVSADILEAGQLLSVELPNFMTMSLPPQTTAVKIEVLNLPVESE